MSTMTVVLALLCAIPLCTLLDLFLPRSSAFHSGVVRALVVVSPAAVATSVLLSSPLWHQS